MEKFQSLADLLGSDVEPLDPTRKTLDSEYLELVDVKDAAEFCKRLVGSRMFREYILRGIILGDLPSAMATRVADHGMGKPPERIEHTGEDGGPIVTVVRRVVIHAQQDFINEIEKSEKPKLTH